MLEKCAFGFFYDPGERLSVFRKELGPATHRLDMLIAGLFTSEHFLTRRFVAWNVRNFAYVALFVSVCFCFNSKFLIAETASVGIGSSTTGGGLKVHIFKCLRFSGTVYSESGSLEKIIVISQQTKTVP